MSEELEKMEQVVPESDISLARQLDQEKKKVAALEQRLQMYEQHGPAKLYYSLNRKMNEMADMLNKTELNKVDLSDPKDKTFDRMKVIWNDASTISIAVKSMGDQIGVTGDEKADVAKKPFLDRLAEPRP